MGKNKKILTEQQELEIEIKVREEEKKQLLIKDYCEMHNKAPVTRRDFLSAGVIGFSGAMVMPTLGSIMSSVANAQEAGECPKADANSNRLSAFVTLNLSGGAALCANYLPMDQGGQQLSSYTNMGLGNSGVPVDREFANQAPFAGDGISKFLEGVRNVSDAETRGKTAFVAVCVRSRDDNGGNPLDATGMVARAGLLGEQLPNLGRRDSATGINHQPAIVRPPNPLIIRRYEDIEGALGVVGTLGRMSESQKVNFFKLIQNLSSSQMSRLMKFSGGQQLAHLVKCATGTNVELASADGGSLDIRQDAQLAGIWGINNNTGSNNESVVFGSMVNAALAGTAGTVNLEKGGYDYHNNTRNTGDDRDRDAGEVVGRILASAAAKNQKVFVYVTSDGSCRSANSDSRNAPWTSDRGSAGVNYILAFDPAGAPEVSGFSIGHFNNGQAADDTTVVGGSPERAAAAVFANWALFNKKPELIDKAIPGVFSANELAQISRFG